MLHYENLNSPILFYILQTPSSMKGSCMSRGPSKHILIYFYMLQYYVTKVFTLSTSILPYKMDTTEYI